MPRRKRSPPRPRRGTKARRSGAPTPSAGLPPPVTAPVLPSLVPAIAAGSGPRLDVARILRPGPPTEPALAPTLAPPPVPASGPPAGPSRPLLWRPPPMFGTLVALVGLVTVGVLFTAPWMEVDRPEPDGPTYVVQRPANFLELYYNFGASSGSYYLHSVVWPPVMAGLSGLLGAAWAFLARRREPSAFVAAAFLLAWFHLSLLAAVAATRLLGDQIWNAFEDDRKDLLVGGYVAIVFGFGSLALFGWPSVRSWTRLLRRPSPHGPSRAALRLAAASTVIAAGALLIIPLAPFAYFDPRGEGKPMYFADGVFESFGAQAFFEERRDMGEPFFDPVASVAGFSFLAARLLLWAGYGVSALGLVCACCARAGVRPDLTRRAAGAIVWVAPLQLLAAAATITAYSVLPQVMGPGAEGPFVLKSTHNYLPVAASLALALTSALGARRLRPEPLTRPPSSTTVEA